MLERAENMPRNGTYRRGSVRPFQWRALVKILPNHHLSSNGLGRATSKVRGEEGAHQKTILRIARKLGLLHGAGGAEVSRSHVRRGFVTYSGCSSCSRAPCSGPAWSAVCGQRAASGPESPLRPLKAEFGNGILASLPYQNSQAACH